MGIVTGFLPEEENQIKREAELHRLERAVIEAAKADMRSELRDENAPDHGIDGMIAARRRYRLAVWALIEFESKEAE